MCAKFLRMARAPDTLKPYQPTIRNRISTALLGDAPASSVRGRFVKGLMGDTGLSATGLGIVDLLPFLQADEAGRQLATKGQRGAGATNLALSVIPIPAVANKLVKPAVKKAAKGVARLIGDVVGEAAPTVSKIADAMEGARPIPVPVVGGPPRNAEGFSAPLDMSQEARMARAAEQGFTVPVFHGTPDARDILETGRFQTPRERIGYPTDELWAAKDRKTASSYADPKRAFDYQNAEPATVEAIMRLKNPMEIDAGGGRWRGTLAAVKEAREKGYDGVIVRNVIDDYQGKGKPTTTFAVFDSNGIKLASDPFHPGGEARVGLPRPGDYKVGGSLPPVPVVMPRAASGADIPPVPVTQPKIVAYHGSPHDFDQFSLDKIGTGEGAQAYGHGLYFAENEGVAQSYRDALGPKPYIHNGLADGAWDDPTFRAATAIHANKGEDGALAVLRGNAQSPRNDATINAILDGSYKKHEMPTGSMYQVGINADPERFLDWDKPLSEQPPNVQQAVANVANLRGESGGYIWDSLVKQKNAEGAFGEHIADPNPAIKTGPKAATEALREAGVPGIKYLDAGSRGTASGVGTRNFVVFDEKLITILKKYGWVPGAALPAAAIAEYTKENGSPPPTVPMV